MQKYDTFAEWWKAEGMKLVYADLSMFEVAQRSWLVSRINLNKEGKMNIDIVCSNCGSGELEVFFEDVTEYVKCDLCEAVLCVELGVKVTTHSTEEERNEEK